MAVALLPAQVQAQGAQARHIQGRQYFRDRYGNNFSETDLWRFDIPTFEEYSQWVTRQSQAFALALLADERSRASRPMPTFLRIYKSDIDLMRALGIRFLVTDELMVRANFIQTLLVFERQADVSLRFEFGLGSKAQCRFRDAEDLA